MLAYACLWTGGGQLAALRGQGEGTIQMLIFVSDLHMPDGSTGAAQVLPEAAFTGTLADLGTHARNAGTTDITLVFLGDAFDIIRSESWFAWPESERPWGESPSEAHVHGVFGRIVAQEHNAASFAALKSDLTKEPYCFPVQPKRIYIPGNHDRLCDFYPSLRRRVVETLGITHLAPGVPIETVDLTTTPFQHEFLDLDHATFARHGQEWDPFNFQGSAALRSEEFVPVPIDDYMQMPIGDVIACEVASKLPRIVRKHVARACGEEVAELTYRRFQDIFDVRPIGAMIPWISYQLKREQDARAQAAVNDAVQEVAREFMDLPFVQRWLAAHHSWLHLLDQADKVELLFELLKSIHLTALQPEVSFAERFLPLFQGDNLASNALKDFQRLDTVPEWRNRLLYVLYGHTHVPDQRAIDVGPPESLLAERVYLNTGTWRPGIHQTLTRTGYMTWKNLTYSMIYRCDENVETGQRTSQPTFEVWTGGLKG